MKLCVNCKYYDNSNFIGHEECGRTISPVDGKPRELCVVERRSAVHEDVCGAEGKYWEERKKTSLDEIGMLGHFFKWFKF